MNQETEEKPHSDFRQNHPIVIRAIKQKKTIVLSDLEIYKVKNSVIEFSTPNIISLFINTSHKSFIEATSVYRKLIEPKLKESKKVRFEKDELSKLYDYFEAVKVSVIFAYNSIEAFVNIAIPDEYIYESKNNKGIKESWDKEAIQKWMSTSDKLINILPELRKIGNPKNEKFWSDFKNLENLRNEIIHPKQLSKELNITNEIHKVFFDENIFKWIQSAKYVLNFYCQGEFSERYFPTGFGPNKIKPQELEDFDEYFAEVE